MRWRIMLELAGADGTPQLHEVGTGERSPAGHATAMLGLRLEEGKAILAAVQRHLVAAQVDEHCRSRRRCDRCGAGTVKLLALGRPSWQAEGDAGTEFKPRQQPR